MRQSDDAGPYGQGMENKLNRPPSLTIISVLIMVLGCVSLISRLIMIAGANPSDGTGSWVDFEMLIFLTLWFAQPIGHIVVGGLLYKMRRLGFWLCLPVVALNFFVDFGEGREAFLSLLVSLGLVLSCVLPHWKKMK